MKRFVSLFVIFFVFAFLQVAPAKSKTNQESNRGTIAYIRNGAEIRLIDPDGSNDRRIWSLPRAELAATMGINGVAWRPDGKEIAFSSAHEAVRSLYLSDLYAIRPDGSGFRRITNPPDPSTYANYPKGTVTVTVTSAPAGILAAPSTSFLVYVAGAEEPQQVALPPGSSRTLTFENVADLGSHPQPVVAMFGKSRWFIPGVDVVAGRTVQAGVLHISGKGLEMFGAYGVAWRNGGSELTYGLGNCGGLFSVPADAVAGSHQDKPPLTGSASANVCTWDWGQSTSNINQILMGGGLLDANIYLSTAGSSSRGEKVMSAGATDLMIEVEWLPDGSGFLFALSTGSSANIYKYNFANKQTTQLTHFDGEFVRSFSVAPDGQSIVFERAAQFRGGNSDLWLMHADGRGQRLLVKNGSGPSWGTM
jgi:TolB protein